MDDDVNNEDTARTLDLHKTEKQNIITVKPITPENSDSLQFLQVSTVSTDITSHFLFQIENDIFQNIIHRPIVNLSQSKSPSIPVSSPQTTIPNQTTTVPIQTPPDSSPQTETIIPTPIFTDYTTSPSTTQQQTTTIPLLSTNIPTSKPIQTSPVQIDDTLLRGDDDFTVPDDEKVEAISFFKAFVELFQFHFFWTIRVIWMMLQLLLLFVEHTIFTNQFQKSDHSAGSIFKNNTF